MSHTPSKTRVSGFRSRPVPETRLYRSQFTFPQRLTRPDPSETASGVPYYGYRFYSPELGRWINRDPIGELGGLNLLRFVQNNPLSQWDYLGWSCSVGDLRNPKVGLTTVRRLGDPNVDRAADDIMEALRDVGKFGDIADVLAVVASHIASGGALTTLAIANLLMDKLGKYGLSPDVAANIAANISNHLRKRGKETQGVHIWTRVCYEECVRTLFSFLCGNSWKEKCEPWKRFKFISGPVTFESWTTVVDASTWFMRAHDQALENFNNEHGF